MRIATVCLAFAMLLSTQAVFAAEKDGVSYSWASKRIEGEIWGIARSDIDGDGMPETLLLERQRLLIGNFEGMKFNKSFECTWEGNARATRLDLFDLDGDGREDALITAVDDGIPASQVLSVGKKGCKAILSGVGLSLRVMDLPPSGDSTEWSRGIVGQGWSSQKYFSGDISEYRFEKGKLKRASKLKLPRHVEIYRFAYLPPDGDASAVVFYRNAGPLEVRVNVRGKKWKRMWRSPEKYGSSGNAIKAVQRPALDQVQSTYVYFELPPIVIRDPGSADIFMVKYDMPLHNIVGRKPYIKGSRIYEYKPDDAFIYAEQLRTQHMPGDAVSYLVDDTEAGRTIFALVQDNRGAFDNPTESMLLRFDLGGKPEVKINAPEESGENRKNLH